MNERIEVSIYKLYKFIRNDPTLSQLEKTLNDFESQNVKIIRKRANEDVNKDLEKVRKAILEIRSVCLFIALTIPETQLNYLLKYFQQNDPDILVKQDISFTELLNSALDSGYLNLENLEYSTYIKLITNFNSLPRLSIMRWACQFKHFEMIQYLIEIGVNINDDDFLNYAITQIRPDIDYRDSFKIVRYLMANGAELKPTHIELAQALLSSTDQRHTFLTSLEILKALLTCYSFDIQQSILIYDDRIQKLINSEDSSSLLKTSIYEPNNELLIFLLKKNLDISKEKQMEYIDFALSYHNYETLGLLIEKWGKSNKSELMKRITDLQWKWSSILNTILNILFIIPSIACDIYDNLILFMNQFNQIYKNLCDIYLSRPHPYQDVLLDLYVGFLKFFLLFKGLEQSYDFFLNNNDQHQKNQFMFFSFGEKQKLEKIFAQKVCATRFLSVAG